MLFLACAASAIYSKAWKGYWLCANGNCTSQVAWEGSEQSFLLKWLSTGLGSSVVCKLNTKMPVQPKEFDAG
jgi:hypothetical protein